jgi:hypothetical protein
MVNSEAPQAAFEELRKLEKTSKVPMPFGNRTMEALCKMAVELSKLNAREALLRSKQIWIGGPAEVEDVDAHLLPEVLEVMKLPEVEQNLFRDAANKVIDLIQMECNLGQYSSRGRDDGVELKKPQS